MTGPSDPHLPEHRSGYLPAVRNVRFALAPDERLPDGVRRVTLEQLDAAIDGLARPGDDIDRAVHQARKAMKRLRAVLRLVRDSIGDDVYRAENALLRDTARLLAPMRDGAVITEAVRDLRDRFGDRLASGVFDDVIERLTERHRRRRRRVLEDETILPTVLRNLRSARARYAAWPADGEHRLSGLVAARPLAHSFETVAGGLFRTYRRGRREMHRALEEPTDLRFHQWRKRVKYLRHQVEVLRPLWPEVLEAQARELDRLGEVLGDEHDLAVMLRLVAALPDLCPDPVDRSLLAALTQHRRAELRTAARILGIRIYAEDPDAFVGRFAAYWRAWQTPLPVGMVPVDR